MKNAIEHYNVYGIIRMLCDKEGVKNMTAKDMESVSIAVVIPCLNESRTIAQVIRSFQTHLPQAKIYVYDNNSTDDTVVIAERFGVNVRHVGMRGKGFVVRRAFRDIDEDVMILVDGDDTYPADKAMDLVRGVVEDGGDLVIGNRFAHGGVRNTSERKLHREGNILVQRAINRRFGCGYIDVLSGFRAYSTKFRNQCDIAVTGFDVETKQVIFALEHEDIHIVQLPISYQDRPDGSESKLRVLDGLSILKCAYTWSSLM